MVFDLDCHHRTFVGFDNPKSLRVSDVMIEVKTSGTLDLDRHAAPVGTDSAQRLIADFFLRSDLASYDLERHQCAAIRAAQSIEGSPPVPGLICFVCMESPCYPAMTAAAGRSTSCMNAAARETTVQTGCLANRTTRSVVVPMMVVSEKRLCCAPITIRSAPA